MPADTDALLEEGKCYACLGDLSTAQIMTLALERQVLLAIDPEADVSMQGLMDYAKCFACGSYANIYDLLELALLDKISQAS